MFDWQNTNIVAVPELGTAFMSMPKCAGSSVRAGLMRKLDPENWHKQGHLDRWVSLHYYSRGQMRESSLFRFSVVRNPFDRLVSCWANRVRGGHLAGPRGKEWTFEEFVHLLHTRALRNDRHIAPQTWMLLDREQPLVDHLLRFETLAEDWKVIQDYCGLAPLKHLNKSEHDHYQTYYTDELRYIVHGLYWQDLRLLGYNFEGDFTPTIPLMEDRDEISAVP